MKATLTRWIKGLTSLTQQRKAGPAPVFHYKGFDIPQDLILKTGGGPETFDVISRLHIYNLQRLVGIRPDDQIIEVGSGIGRDAIPLTEILSSRGSYLGVDIIEQSIAWCHSAITADTRTSASTITTFKISCTIRTDARKRPISDSR
jgi:hypothetical protein